jgi:opacity protein-like surface antigen
MSWRTSTSTFGLLMPAACLAGFVGVADAADWSVDPRITLNADYNDNNRLTSVPGEEIEVMGAEINAQVAFGAATPRTRFRLIPRVRANYYPDDSDEQTDSEYLIADWEFTGQRYEGAINAQLSRRETLGSFLPDDFDDDIGGDPGDGDDLGTTPDRNVQDRIEFTPDVSFELTERSRLELGVGYIDVSFEEQVQDDREDYASASADVGYRFLLSPTKSVAVRVRGRQYDPSDDVSTDSQALELEWSNNLSDTSRLYFRGGGSRVEEIDELGDSEWNTGFTGGAGVQRTFEVTDLLFEVSRGLDPNSSGRLVARDELRFRFTRRLSEVTRLLIGARGVRDEKSTDQDVFQERRYLSASVGFDWRMTRQFTLGGGYEYVWRDVEDQAEDAQSNRLFLGVTWEPHRL